MEPPFRIVVADGVDASVSDSVANPESGVIREATSVGCQSKKNSSNLSQDDNPISLGPGDPVDSLGSNSWAKQRLKFHHYPPLSPSLLWDQTRLSVTKPVGGVRVCHRDSPVYWLLQRQPGNADPLTNLPLKGLANQSLWRPED